MLRIAGFAVFAAASVCAVSYWYVDRQLQAFRLTDKPTSAYLFVPVRWRRDLYRPEGHHLVDRAWSLLVAMYGLAVVGMLLIAAGS
jgi:hypothetical protein